MIIKYSSLVGSIVAELKDQTQLGKISDIVINNENFCVAAIVLEPPFWFFGANKFILAMDIVHLLKDGVIVRDAQSAIDQTESVNLDRLVKAKSYGIGQKVVTDTGETLGHVYDFLIETESRAITKFYVKALGHDRIISVDMVVLMEGRLITIKENYAVNRIKTAVMTETLPTG